MQNHRDLLGRSLASAVLICVGIAAVLAVERAAPAADLAVRLQGLWDVYRGLLLGPVFASLKLLVPAGFGTLLFILVVTRTLRRDHGEPPILGIRLLGVFAMALPAAVIASTWAFFMAGKMGSWATSGAPDSSALIPPLTMTLVMLIALALRTGVAGHVRDPAQIAEILAQAGRDLGFCLPVLAIAETIYGYPGAGFRLVSALLASNWFEVAALTLAMASCILVIGLVIDLLARVLGWSTADD